MKLDIERSVVKQSQGRKQATAGPARVWPSGEPASAVVWRALNGIPVDGDGDGYDQGDVDVEANLCG